MSLSLSFHVNLCISFLRGGPRSSLRSPNENTAVYMPL